MLNKDLLVVRRVQPDPFTLLAVLEVYPVEGSEIVVGLDEERLVDPRVVQIVRGGRQQSQQNVTGGQRL